MNMVVRIADDRAEHTSRRVGAQELDPLPELGEPAARRDEQKPTVGRARRELRRGTGTWHAGGKRPHLRQAMRRRTDERLPVRREGEPGERAVRDEAVHDPPGHAVEQKHRPPGPRGGDERSVG
jgi:hypothetical protein